MRLLGSKRVMGGTSPLPISLGIAQMSSKRSTCQEQEKLDVIEGLEYAALPFCGKGLRGIRPILGCRTPYFQVCKVKTADHYWLGWIDPQVCVVLFLHQLINTAVSVQKPDSPGCIRVQIHQKHVL